MGFLFSGKANAWINEPGISLLSPQCKLNFKIEHDKIKKSLLRKKSNADNRIQRLKKIKEWKCYHE